MALAAYKELLFIPRPSVVTWALLLPFLCSNPVWCINHRGCLLLFIVPRLFLSTRAARGLAFRARRLYTTRSERVRENGEILKQVPTVTSCSWYRTRWSWWMLDDGQVCYFRRRRISTGNQNQIVSTEVAHRRKKIPFCWHWHTTLL